MNIHRFPSQGIDDLRIGERNVAGIDRIEYTCSGTKFLVPSAYSSKSLPDP